MALAACAVEPATPWMLDAISRVVTLCSSTAAEIAVETSPMRPMMLPISFIAATVSSVAPRTVSIWAPISAVALAVCAASAFTSPATTAKPLPASPARAASIVAFSASRLVWLAMLSIRRTTSPMRAVESARPRMVAWLASARCTAWLSHLGRDRDLAGDFADAGGELLDRGGDGGEVGGGFAGAPGGFGRLADAPRRRPRS